MQFIDEEDNLTISICTFNALTFFLNKFSNRGYTDFQLTEIYHRLREKGSYKISFYREFLKKNMKHIEVEQVVKKPTLEEFNSDNFKKGLRETIESLINDLETQSSSIIRKALQEVHGINVDYDTVYFTVQQIKQKSKKIS